MKTRVICGPAPCTVCRRPVVWDGFGWLFAGTMLAHVPATCPGAPRSYAVVLADRMKPR
jgi:hypothetical protein